MMKNMNKSLVQLSPSTFTSYSTDRNLKVSLKPISIAVCKMLNNLSLTFSFGTCAFGVLITPAWSQGNISMPRLNPSQAITEAGSKVIAVSTMQSISTNSVAYKRIDGVNLNSSNSNLPVSADEGLWRESLGLPQGSKILLSASTSQAPADGQTQLKIKVEVFDADGKPYRKPTKLLLETSLGSFQGVNSILTVVDTFGVQKRAELNQLQIAIDQGVVELILLAPTVPGDSLLKVSSGAIAAQGEITFLPDLRDMLVVGIVEGAINLSKAKGLSAADIKEMGFSDNLRNWEKSTTSVGIDDTKYKSLAGRVALFVKGTIKGEYLLTAALDTDKITSQKLFRDIDPNVFYPVYGDSSSKRFDAQSTSRLYVRVDKNKSYLLYGDYNTISTDQANKLANLGRTLTGVQGHYENENFKLTAFAAKTANKGFVDEQPGTGISGPYALGKPNAIANSETVELLVRDKNQPSIVLSRKLLARFVDYDFEPFSGRVLFRQPVPSSDENNNPVSIRISYEVDDETGDKHWIGGLSAKMNIGSNAAIGATYAKDQDLISPYEIAGANFELKLGEHTYLVAEVAKSKGTNAYNQSLSVITETNPLTRQSGKATRIEVRHDGDSLKLRAYANHSDTGFQNTSAGVLAGRQESGLIASYQIKPNVVIDANIVQTKDDSGTSTDGAFRNAAGISASVKIADNLKVEVGVNSVKEHLVNGSAGAQNTAGEQLTTNSSVPGWGFNGTRLLASPNILLSNASNEPAIIDNEYTSGRIKILGKISPKISIFGEYERAIDDTARKKLTVGGEYRLTENSRFYARHEIENSLTGFYGLSADGTRNANTVIGIDTAVNVPYFPDGQLYSEYRSAGGIGNSDVAAVAGIRNTWKFEPGVVLTTALEQQNVVQANGEKHNATAISVGGEYTASSISKAAARLEYRTSDTQNQWLSTLAYTRSLSDNWSAIAKNAYIRFEGVGPQMSQGIQLQNQFQAGLAYRDTEEGRLNGLMRIENKINKSSLTSSITDENTWIYSLHGTYHPSRSWSFAGQLAAKQGSQVISNEGKINKYKGELASARVIWDLAERVDASLYGSYGRDNAGKLTGVGVELGTRILDNLWLSAGYTKGRFADVDQFSSNTSWSGWHLRLRYKFNQKSLGLSSSKIISPKTLTPSIPVVAEQILQTSDVVKTNQQAEAKKISSYEKISILGNTLFEAKAHDLNILQNEGRSQLDKLILKYKDLDSVDETTVIIFSNSTNKSIEKDSIERLNIERANTIKQYLIDNKMNAKKIRIEVSKENMLNKSNCILPVGAIKSKAGLLKGSASEADLHLFQECSLPNRRIEIEIVQ